MRFVWLLVATLLVALISGCGEGEPNADKIKSDLLGKRMSNRMEGWAFDSLDHFEKFQIENKQRVGNVLEYKVDMQLYDKHRIEAGMYERKIGIRAHAKALIVYRKTGGEWEIASIVPQLLEIEKPR